MTRPQDMGITPSFTPRLILSLLLCGLVLFVDGYDLAAMPLALPHIAKALDIPPARFGFALSAVLLGLGVGAVLLAPLGDRFGRRRMITLSVICIGLLTMATASGTNIASFIIWRLLTGLALGACLPNVTSLAAIWAPPGRRASTLTIVSLGISFGAIVAGLIAPPLIALGGWRALFLLPGAATLLLALALFLLFPPEKKAEPGTDARAVRPLARILRRPLRFPTIVFALLYGINAFGLYLIISWTPTLLPQAGFTLDQAARSITIIQSGGLVIALALAWLIDRNHAVLALAGAYVTIIAAFALLAILSTGTLSTNLLLLVAGGGIVGVHLCIMAVVTGVFPPDCLATAIGFGVAVARIGAIGGPLAGGWLIGNGAGPGSFFLFAILPMALCLLITFALPAARRAGQSGCDHP
ncbi:MAG: MFS transporter [Alphaproteobacteria bacterium]|nr:MFS transporter [Alphaproteobacteria bacterium]